MYQYSKQFLSTKDLADKFLSASIIIDSKEEVEEAIKSVGYYRLKGYALAKYNFSDKKYTDGTCFSDILNLYLFDRELSHLIFCYLSKIEVALKARLIEAFQGAQDVLVLHDPSIFDDKELYWRNQSTIAKEIARSNDAFIEHNFSNHDGAIPIWATVEVLSFGTLSKIIKNMKIEKNNSLSLLMQNYKFLSKNGNEITPSKDMFTSWIHSLSIMRNICAHNARIYNRSISTRPKLIYFDITNPQP